MINRSKRNTILDIILFLLMLAVFSIKGEYRKPLAITFGVLVILYIVWHWQQFKIIYRQLIPDRTCRYLVDALIAVFITTVVTLPLYITKEEHIPDRVQWIEAGDQDYGRDG